MPPPNYNVSPCFACEEPITFRDLRESVRWTPRSRWTSLYYDEMEEQIMHRRCWKDLAESVRERVREGAAKAPESLGGHV